VNAAAKKTATSLTIFDLFQYLGLRLHVEKEDLFLFYVLFENAYFGQWRGSLFGGFEPGRPGASY
jgi:hypothetical protein